MLEFFAFLALGGFTFITWLDAREAKAEALRARADLNRLLIFLTGLSPSGVARKVEATPIEPAASFSSAPESARAPKANPWQTGKTEVEPVVAAVSEAVAPEPEITPIVVAAVPSQPIEQKAAPASLPRPDVEQSFATRWAVWIGGAALSLGGLLIVKYSIEAGYFGPSVRLVLGAAFALALAFASEFIRRHDLKLPDLGLATQHIPAMLAGISVLSGLAVIYSAYALYGFIGAEVAFALLGVLGLAAISVSLLHGPYFGLFGLVSSYLTPILVSTGKAPNYVALVAFFSVVTVAGLLIERLRPSKQLLLGAVIGHALWTALIALGTPGEVWGSLMLGIAILIAVIRVEMVRNHAQEHKTEQRHAPLHLLAPFVVPLVLGGALWVEQGGEVLTRLALLMLVSSSIVAAIRHRGYWPLAPIAGAAAAGLILLWPDPTGTISVGPQVIIDLLRLSLPPRAATGMIPMALVLIVIVTLVPFAVLVRGWRNGGGDFYHRGALAFTSALAPVCFLLAISLRINGFERSLNVALLAAGLTLLLAFASNTIFKQESKAYTADPNVLIGSSAYAASSAIGLGLAVAFGFTNTWLVLGFAIASCGVAYVASQRPLPLLRAMASALGTAALLRILWSPILAGQGSWSFAADLCLAYGFPALAFACGAFFLYQRRDRALNILEGLTTGFCTVFVALAVFLLFFGPDVVHACRQLLLRSLQITLPQVIGFMSVLSICLATLVIIYAFAARCLGSKVLSSAASAVLAITAMVSLGGLAFYATPLFMPAVDEPMILNSFLFGHVGTAAVLILLARIASKINAEAAKPKLMRQGAVLLGAVGAFLIVRQAFHGSTLTSQEILTLAESGIYSTIALAIAAVYMHRCNAYHKVEPAVFAAAVFSAAFLATGGGHAQLYGWFIVNNSAIGLAMPAILSGIICWWTQRHGGSLLASRIYGAASVVGGLVFVVQQVRFLFPGSDWMGGFDYGSDPKRLLGYSLVIIAYGLSLLISGLRYGHRDLRLAALAVMALAIFKVFLLDLSGLQGLWRPVSFIGLGISLIGIAYLYRGLMPKERSSQPQQAP